MCCKQLYLPTSGAIRALIDGKGEAVTHVGTTRPLYILYAVEPRTPLLMRLRIYVVYIRGCDTYVIALPFLRQSKDFDISCILSGGLLVAGAT